MLIFDSQLSLTAYPRKLFSIADLTTLSSSCRVLVSFLPQIEYFRLNGLTCLLTKKPVRAAKDGFLTHT